MKKVIIALGAIAIACGVQAAAFSWSVSTGTQYAGYDVYLTKSAGSFSSIKDITAALVGTVGVDGNLAKASASARNATAANTAKGIASEGSVDFYYVFVNDNDYWVSSKQTITAVAETATPNKNTFSTTSANALLGGAATGKFSSVPEPTSGLLLLLGMAGLALKRKVA